jgi:signal transduction histidine kinase/CheY-like chemotaxis protein
MPEEDESRVLFLAPTRKDARVGQGVIASAGFRCYACDSLLDLCREIPRGGGAVVVPAEAILRDPSGMLSTALRDQPAWSNLPVLVLIAAGRVPGRRIKALLDVGDVTLLKRPLDINEFLNAVRSAVRDRTRQYLVRDHLAEKERQADLLRDADRRKDEFLAMLAHELRNPLAPIRNGLEILRMTGDNPDALTRTRGMMSRQVEHLARLVDDLLDVSRITRGKVDLQLEPVDLNFVLARAVEATRPLIEAHRHRLIMTQPSRPVWVTADLTRMTQVVGNLLTNAAKYSEDEGRIELTLEENGEATVRVRDRGVGIAAEMLPRVFDLFTQAGRTLDRSDGGLGIGLTLVRSLVELHGGTVSASSAGLGRGSEFVVRLPIRAQPPVPTADVSVTVEPAHHRRILVVDDNSDAGDSLAMLLEMTGHQVQIARNGMQAVEIASLFKPDVGLLDIGLPGMNGYELAKRLRNEPFGKDLLLIALTGYGQEDDRRRTREAGFDHHLTKPADTNVLFHLIAEHSLRA